MLEQADNKLLLQLDLNKTLSILDSLISDKIGKQEFMGTIFLDLIYLILYFEYFLLGCIVYLRFIQKHFANYFYRYKILLVRNKYSFYLMVYRTNMIL